MTLQEFSRDVVPIVMMGLGVLGLGSLVLVWQQIRETAKWNKLQGQAGFLSRPVEAVEQAAGEALRPFGVDLLAFGTPVSQDQLARIIENERAHYAIKSYLNLFEDLAAAVRIGFVDEDFAYALESAKLARTWCKFEPLVVAMRARANDEEIYIEFENVANKWLQRSDKATALRREEHGRSRAKMGLSRAKG